MTRAKRPRRATPPEAALDAVRDLFRAWGAEGGKQGGKLRWKGVTAEERSRIARAAVQARWTKSKKRPSA